MTALALLACRSVSTMIGVLYAPLLRMKRTMEHKRSRQMQLHPPYCRTRPDHMPASLYEFSTLD